MWTRFHDMHSGGGLKEKPYSHIFIEAPEDEAKVIFYNRFGHNPERVTCTCCGEDYSIHSGESLEQLTGYERRCAFGYFRPDGTECSRDEAWTAGKGFSPNYTSKYIERQSEDLRQYITGNRIDYLERNPTARYRTLQQYRKDKTVLFIPASDIKPDERQGEVPEQGYVWV